MKRILAASVLISASIVAQAAEPLHLRARNGVEIQIDYRKQSTLSVGDSYTDTAKDVLVHVYLPAGVPTPSDVQAVLLNLCEATPGGRYQATYVARVTPAGARIPEEAQTLGESYDIRYLAGFDGLLISKRHRSGLNENCRQQIAVAIDGIWLEDPMQAPGEHNFNLQF